MTAALVHAVEQALCCGVRETSRRSGGDVSTSYAVDLADGSRVFVKTQDPAPHRFFACEARGLDWLRACGAIRVPEVRAHADRPEASVAFLALEWIEPGPRPSDFDARLGRGLAALHRLGAETFGLERDGFIGPLPQRNEPRDSWAEFYRDCRLAPLVRRAHGAGLLDAHTAARFDRLLERLEERVGDPEPPARLHGDLWNGNLLCDARGCVCLIDPAVYGGHREVDLAMLRLFGGAGEAAFDAYREAFPLAEGWAERIPLYQLYPLLVHLLLFGASYAEAVERTLERCMRAGARGAAGPSSGA